MTSIKELSKGISGKHIATSLVGGALLYYASKNRSTTAGRIASLAGASLLGHGLSGTAGFSS